MRHLTPSPAPSVPAGLPLVILRELIRRAEDRRFGVLLALYGGRRKYVVLGADSPRAAARQALEEHPGSRILSAKRRNAKRAERYLRFAMEIAHQGGTRQ